MNFRGCVYICIYLQQIPCQCRLISSQGSTAEVMPASYDTILGQETQFASLASEGTRVITPSQACPFSSQTHIKAQCSPPPFQPTCEKPRIENSFTNQISTLTTTLQPTKATKSISSKDHPASVSDQKDLRFCADAKGLRPDAANQAGVDSAKNHQNHKSQEENGETWLEPGMEQAGGRQAADVYKYLSRTGSWSRSASLPRGYRRSEGSCRLSSAITARPFGTKQSRVSSLPRLCNVSSLAFMVSTQ